MKKLLAMAVFLLALARGEEGFSFLRSLGSVTKDNEKCEFEGTKKTYDECTYSLECKDLCCDSRDNVKRTCL